MYITTDGQRKKLHVRNMRNAFPKVTSKGGSLALLLEGAPIFLLFTIVSNDLTPVIIGGRELGDKGPRRRRRKKRRNRGGGVRKREAVRHKLHRLSEGIQPGHITFSC